jgi:hypothetical protein
MGTRANTVIYDEYHGNGSSVQILNLYRQHDGYVEGHGAELVAFLEPMTIVNGITTGMTNIANGSGCLAAQMVAHFKKKVGDFYIMAPLGEEMENDFTYKIYVSGGPVYISMQVWHWDDLIFSGNVPEFKKFVEDNS